MQDLRAGLILKATPYRQQIMQIVGVLAAAVVLGPVLQILMDAYGFGSPTDEHPHALRAPQATLMASVAEGVFGGSLPWPYFFSGAAMGLCAQAVDVLLVRSRVSFRVPVLAFALGLYLPWELSGPILMGGLLANVASRNGRLSLDSNGGILAGAGLITGEALLGILLAAVVGGFGSLESLHVGVLHDSMSLSLLVVAGALYFLWRAFRGARA
jgi:putative OPT family oligopeptide transporter